MNKYAQGGLIGAVAIIMGVDSEWSGKLLSDHLRDLRDFPGQ